MLKMTQEELKAKMQEHLENNKDAIEEAKQKVDQLRSEQSENK